jgi:hypothetical protein
MSDPDEHFIPEDGDPWQQQQQELEHQEAEASAISAEHTSKAKINKPAGGDKGTVPDSGEPF